MNNIDSGQVWYYYDIPEPKPREVCYVPVSQIPLLNGIPCVEPDRPVPRRGGEGINSKYIKLAKAGGRKDLLLYDENKQGKKMQEYNRVDWFDHPDTKPDTKVGRPRIRHPRPPSPRETKPVSMLTEDAPFNTDECLVWNESDEDARDQYLTRQAQKQRALNKLNLPPMPLPKPRLEPIIIKKINKAPLGENNEPVSFSHLLSHGYQADWSKNRIETLKQKKETERKNARERKENLTKHLEVYKKGGENADEKPLFKMKKFANTSHKIVNS